MERDEYNLKSDKENHVMSENFVREYEEKANTTGNETTEGKIIYNGSVSYPSKSKVI